MGSVIQKNCFVSEPALKVLHIFRSMPPQFGPRTRQCSVLDREACAIASERGGTRRPRSRPLVIITMAFIALEMAGCGKKTTPPSTSTVVTVQATAVKQTVVHRVLDAAGTLLSPQHTNITSAIPGRLVSLQFVPGQVVRKGEVLAHLRSTAERAAFKAAEAARANAQQVFRNDEKLLTLGGVSSEQALHDASVLDAADAHVAQAREHLDETDIKAPYSGVLGFRELNVGAFVAAGESITTIQQVNPLSLEISLPQVDSENVRTGLPVSIEVPGVPGTLSGRVAMVGPSLDAVLHSFRVMVDVTNGAGRLKPGMFAIAHVVVEPGTDVVLIPEQAISPEAGIVFVWCVRRDKTAQRKAVTLGTYRRGQVEVLKGLSPADVVITAGMQKLHEGSKVEVTAYQPVERRLSADASAEAAER